VTDRDVVADPEFVDRAAAAVSSGAGDCVLQLRAHGHATGALLDLACELREICASAGAGFWINDRVDVALAVRADGVQLGVGSIPSGAARRVLGRDVWIGRSAHSSDEAALALDVGADVAVLGNVYATASHPDRAPLGLSVLKRAAEIGRPIVAIGGITPERTSEVLDAGAHGIAVLSGVWHAEDPASAAKAYARELGRRMSDVEC
jgi:thiamine-phosphate pyrophosphorylase